MARLLLCVISGISLTGCLIPQDDQVLPELPPIKNRPPRIVAQTPPVVSISFNGSLMCPTNTRFSLTVSDPDVRDTLRSFWFIDKSETSVTPFQPTEIDPSASETRVIDAPTSTGFTSALANLLTGTHLLTAYVSDRNIEEIDRGVVKARDTVVTLPDGTTEIDPGYVVEHTWLLRVEPCP